MDSGDGVDTVADFEAGHAIMKIGESNRMPSFGRLRRL